MTAEAIIMMSVAILTVWGGLVAAIVNLRLRSSDREH
ncbi:MULTISPECIES: methionine/alanine import family NSS transporter small subunit [Gulosibacter]|nr:methionine/alanine import family NSS transporter small subunit [Gulosibacter hominis]